jgi:hypothetical protein
VQEGDEVEGGVGQDQPEEAEGLEEEEQLVVFEAADVEGEVVD